MSEEALSPFVRQIAVAATNRGRAEPFVEVLQQALDREDVVRGLRTDLVTGRLRPDDAEPAVMLCLALALLEGITTYASLQVALESAGKSESMGTAVLLKWSTSDGWEDERLLHPITARLLSASGAVPAAKPVFDALDVWLRRRSAGLPFGTDAHSAVTGLLAGAVALHRWLPGALFAHVVGVLRMAPCTASSRARKLANRPLGAEYRGPDVDGAEQAVDDVVDDIATAPSVSDADDVSEVMTRVLAILARKAKGGRADDVEFRVMSLVGELRACPAHARNSILAIVLALQMLRLGTRRRSRAALATVHAYVATVFRLSSQWRSGLATPLDLSDEQRAGFYHSVVQDETQDQDVASALAAFDHILVATFGTTPVPVRGRGPAVLSMPERTLVWDSEVDRAIAQIQASGGDPHVSQAAVLMLRLASEVPMRRSELARLEARDIDSRLFKADAVTLLIRGHRNDPDAKSRATNRPALLTSPALIQALRRYMDERGLEPGVDAVKLFSRSDDAQGQKLFRDAAGLASMVLRNVTGERPASLHSLRHSAISKRCLAALGDSNVGTHDPLLEVAAWAGHATPATTLKHYFHLYADAIRQAIDRSLVPLLSSAAVSRWSGYKDATLRQRRHRHGLQAFSAALADGVTTGFPCVTKRFTWADFDVAMPTTRVYGFGDATALLIAIDKGLSCEATASRTGVPAHLVECARRVRARWHRALPEAIERRHLQSRKVTPLRRFVARRFSSELVQDAVAAGCRSVRCGVFSGADLEAVAALLRLLAAAGFAAHQVVVVAGTSDPASGQSIEQLVALMFGHRPRVIGITSRAGKALPRWCVVDRRIAADVVPGSAAMSMNAVAAMLCCCEIARVLIDTTPEVSRPTVHAVVNHEDTQAAL
jgi:integrase